MIVLLSRIQFAFTVAFHFLFVPLTIGLILLTAIFQTLAVVKKDTMYRRLADFWGELFVINFAIGIVTGLIMPIQFGTNWSAYSIFMGDVFGSPLALEALLAFFLESTFAGIWIFKRHKLSDKFRMAVVWLITLGTTISAIWIITANGFMQHPVGYEMAADGSKVLLTNFADVVLNPYSLFMLAHTLLSAFLLGAFFVVCVSAYHFMKEKKDPNSDRVAFFKKSMTVAVIVGLMASILIPIEGNAYAKYLGQNDVQPLKGAILRDQVDANGQMTTGEVKENSKEANIDAKSEATMQAAADNLNNLVRKPPVKFIYYSFMAMQVLGFFFLGFFLFLLLLPKLLQKNKLVQKIAIYSIPLPYIAITLGWIVAEVGRQPWLVYNLMTVEDGVSNVAEGAVWFSLFTLIAFYVILFAMDLYLLMKKARKGPRLEEKGGVVNES
jgi:cytochrome d ubiquinol oxidase subunit I